MLWLKNMKKSDIKASGKNKMGKKETKRDRIVNQIKDSFKQRS